MMQSVVLCCSVLQCDASLLQCVAVCVAVWCALAPPKATMLTGMQCDAVLCIVLLWQRVAVCCIVMQCEAV